MTINSNLPLTERIEKFINDYRELSGIIITDYVPIDEILNISTDENLDLQHNETYILIIGILNIINNSQIKHVEICMPQYVLPKEKLDTYIEVYNNLTEHLYYNSAQNNYFWKGCQFSVYKNTFNKRFEKHKETYPDVNLLEYIEHEITQYEDESDYIDEDKFNSTLEFIEYEPAGIYGNAYLENCYSDLRETIILSQNRKIEYLFDRKEEIDDSNINEENQDPQYLPKTLTADYYALTFILDTLAKDEKLPTGQKKRIIDGFKVYQSERSSNTLYKKYNEIVQKDLNNLSTLDSIAEDWLEVVLKLSINPDSLKNYLKQKGLI